ncbi:HAMP domain-containing sensor histidine kinase [Patulibacter brassicae]|uniref:histidine kinase n=1 Tax=Patulibacter brassicae TaxID=1705717 RepID=A0ABU4VG76_9ACTN|nr:HAMP domain-containing sensor histidine kinase [Patulibacter brassicae]MDX8150816.1 HAMP domain-containing sensor histidine kinase [Patulibacter brassicae]
MSLRRSVARRVAGLSLRARLLLALVLLVALGMVVLGGVVYASQRSFLLDRADDQAEAARPAVLRQITRDALGDPFGRANGSRSSGVSGTTSPLFPAGGGPGGPPAPRDVPVSAYGQLRDAQGNVLAAARVTQFAEDLPRPRLPERLDAGRAFTTGSAASGVRYRVRTFGSPDGAVLAVAVPLTSVDESLDQLLLVAAIVIVLTLVLLAAVAWWIVRLGLRPLERMADTADAIAAGDLSRRVEESGDPAEVGRLGSALNGMLGRLEGAFAEREASEERLRRFLSDASHELRTPLASIRGYAELHRVGALPDGEAVDRAMGRIEDESARMGTLVEELLLLARLDETPERAQDPVDLAILVEDAAHDARATAPTREVTATVTSEDAVVSGDADQLRQVLANLVRNALVHTPDDAAIDLAVRRDGATVEVEVRDHGPGLPDGDPEQLFGRFWRKEGAGRQRGAAGAGLGLAIVAAIVEAHEGTVAARTAEGGGAAFLVRLPHRPAVAADA